MNFKVTKLNNKYLVYLKLNKYQEFMYITIFFNPKLIYYREGICMILGQNTKTK